MVIMADVGVAILKQGACLEGVTLNPLFSPSEHIFRAGRGGGMALPKIVLRGRKVILLSGFKDGPKDKSKHRALVVDAEDKLQLAAKRNPDAVAFGYVAGEWIAAA
jgi:hypothetical protein